jgi:hypothetical protein
MAIACIRDSEMISESLYLQDEFDRASTLLYGINDEFGTPRGMSSPSPIKINNNCLQCSGNAQYVKKAFKIACLTYKTSKVDYLGQKYDRNDLHAIRSEVLQKIGQLVTQGNELLDQTELGRDIKTELSPEN